MRHFTISAFGDEIGPSLSLQIKTMLDHGIDHLDFRGMEGKGILDYSKSQITEAYGQLAAQGIQVSAIGSPIGKIPIIENFEPHLDKFKYTLDLALVLHTQNIRIFSFYIPQGEDPQRYRDEVMERMNRFVEASKGSGLTLLHENEKGIYGDRADRCLDLLQTMNCSYFKAIFDPANFIQCDEETYPYAFKLLKKQVVYLHIKDALINNHSVVPAGAGDGKIPEILKELQQDGFQGVLSLEPHLDNNLPGGGPVNFARAAQALKKIMTNLGEEW